MKFLALLLCGVGVIWWLHRLFQVPQSRTSATRELLEKLAAEMKAEGVKLPVYRYRVPDGRERMQGKVTLSPWQQHQARVQARLAEERRRA